VLCIEVVGSANTKDEISIPTIASDSQILEDNSLNQSEKVIVSLLSSRIAASGNQLRETSEYNLYVEHLRKYLSSAGVTISDDSGKKAASKILEMSAIMDLEQENNIEKMTLDGRELAINLSQEIYKACGLTLNYNLKGQITRISDKTGKFIYLNESQLKQTGFQFDLFLITFGIIAFLLFICIIIAKKHQLYVKDVAYDGFNEERYAQ
jgi:hypothetical protein